MLTGMACAVWVLALGAWMRSEGGAFNVLFRFVLIPMTLFSGSFFPISRDAARGPLARLDLPALARQRTRQGRGARWSRLLAGGRATWPTWPRCWSAGCCWPAGSYRTRLIV